MNILNNFKNDYFTSFNSVSLAAVGVGAGVVSTCVFGGPLTIVGGAYVGGIMSAISLISSKIFKSDARWGFTGLVIAAPLVNTLGLDLTQRKIMQGFRQTAVVIALAYLVYEVASSIFNGFNSTSSGSSQDLKKSDPVDLKLNTGLGSTQPLTSNEFNQEASLVGGDQQFNLQQNMQSVIYELHERVSPETGKAKAANELSDNGALGLSSDEEDIVKSLGNLDVESSERSDSEKEKNVLKSDQELTNLLEDGGFGDLPKETVSPHIQELNDGESVNNHHLDGTRN